MSAYLFSDSSASRLLSSPPPPANPSVARAHLTSSLLTMGFPLSRITSLVSLLNPSQPNAIEVALELLTRDSPPPSPLTPPHPSHPHPSPPPLHPHHLPPLLHPLSHLSPPSPSSSSSSSPSPSSLSLLLLMTNCTPDEAHLALAREAGDINAAAEYILQRQERKEGGVGAGGGMGGGREGEKGEEEERRREDGRRRRKERRRVKAAEWRKVEEEGGMAAGDGGGGGRRLLHFGDVLLVRHVQSEEWLTVDSEANAVPLAPYATPSFTSPSPSAVRSVTAVTSPLTLPLSHSFHTPRTTSALPPVAPPSLSLASSPSPTSLSSRSLLSFSPPMKRTQGMGLGSSAFFPSTPPHPVAGSSLPPSHPLASPPSLSLSLSPHRTASKPRSFSTPRKSSHPLSLSLPSHHRYHLTLRRAPPSSSSPSPTTPSDERNGEVGEGEGEDDAGLVMTGDRVVLETYERCYLCVEADGSVGCNRMAPLTQQMHFRVQVEEKGAEASGEGGEEDDIRPVEANAVVTLSTVDRHFVGVEAKHAVAKEARPSLSHHFTLSLAHQSTAHHRRHRHSASSGSPLSLATVPASTAATPPTAAALRWAYLRANFRLLAMSVLQAAIAEKQVELMQKQRTQRLQREDAERLCSICLTRSCEVVLLDCGHSCVCELCAVGLKECVVCRTKVQRVVVIRAA